MNSDWTKATKRISPQVLILLLKLTGEKVSQYYQSLNLHDKAIFPIAWAGESESYNWMHLAREYTEKWHHQQQIREAVSKQEIMTREFFYPSINTFFMALPYTFSGINAPTNTLIQIQIPTSIGGEWYLQKQVKGWHLVNQSIHSPLTTVIIPPAIAWKLFTKSIRPHEISEEILIHGNLKLGQQVLNMVAVMA